MPPLRRSLVLALVLCAGLGLALSAGLMSLAGTVSPAVLAQPAPRPNVVLFIADDLAWDDTGAYGNPKVGTPSIDRLAREGMRFTHAFVTISSCSPSRASMITGRYPHATDAEQLHWPLPAAQVTFVEKLKAAGYWTGASGKWHMGAGDQGPLRRRRRPGRGRVPDRSEDRQDAGGRRQRCGGLAAAAAPAPEGQAVLPVAGRARPAS